MTRPVAFRVSQDSTVEPPEPAWNELLFVAAPDIFHKIWHDKFKKKLNERINRVEPMRAIEIFCQSDEQKCHPDVASFLSAAAFKAVDEIVKPGRDHAKAFDFLADMRSTKCVDLLSRMLRKAWPLKDDTAKNDDDTLLTHLLTWPTWPGFLKFFGNRSSKNTLLTSDCWDMIIRAESCVDHLIHSVQTASVTVDTLQVLKRHSNQFLTLGEIIEANQSKTDKEKGASRTPIRTSFHHRLEELKLFHTQQKQLTYFVVNLCHSFNPVDEKLEILRERLNEDISQRSICDLCIRGVGGIGVVFFDLDPKIYTIVSKVYEIQTSRIFNQLWKDFSEKLQGEIVSMELIFEAMWPPLHQELTSIKQQFLDGEMQIKQVHKYLRMFKTNYDELQNEFELFLTNFRDPDKGLEVQKLQLSDRIQQVRDYKKLFNAGDAAQSIMWLKQKIKLTGDFSQVESIAEVIGGKFSSQPIKSVSPELLKAGKLLEMMTKDRTNCLTAFRKCSNLVNWLGENLKDQQELKVFVDLAMISAGESDVEIDRISFMHTSCLGFGSLIFGLKPEHGFQDLMRLCKPVWQAVDANPSLPEKLEYTNRHLSWLEQIKESHGSVALTTLMQVEAINSSGVYHIADPEFSKFRKNKNGNGVDGVSLENTICLVVPGDEKTKRETKIYSLEEVKDVQSKLMLIAGKAENGKDEVDQFVEVFEGVLRIGSLYVQLCEVGEINYLTWKIIFESSKLPSKRDQLLEEINNNCSKMENDLKEWKEHIDKNRMHCYSLNHFTMKQILRLRKDLALACIGQRAVDELSLQTFMLLESVCKDVEPLSLANALGAVVPEHAVFMTERGLSDDQNYFENEEDQSEAEPEEASLIAPAELRPRLTKRKNSLETFHSARETLEGMGYDEEVIIASLRACGRDALEEEFVLWVVNNEQDEDSISVLCQEALDDPGLSDIIGQFMDLDNGEFENMDDEQQDSLASSKSELTKEKHTPVLHETYVNNDEDTYLTLLTLSDVLERLSRSETVALQRKFPTHLKEGEPNLLLVPKSEVFACVLTLFMGAGNQSLPTDEEVIVCDEKTTAEEIVLLWRRAVVDKNSLLFCLANADLLDYDVSQQAIRALDRITQGESHYRVVVMCSLENEDRSNMVASLDQFRRQFPPLTSLASVQVYLKKQLEASREHKLIDQVDWQPAATVDKNRLSVRVVQSSRAGVGKSLVVKRLARKLENLPNNKKLRRHLVSSLCHTIPVHGASVDCDKVTRALSVHAVKPDIPVSRIFHLDISQSVIKGLDTFLFNLFILRTIKDSSGNVWRRKSTDMYAVEVTTDKTFSALASDETSSDESYSQSTRKRLATSKYSFLKFLPQTRCLTPRETLFNMQQDQKGDTEFDMEKFRSVEYQRTFQYLKLFHAPLNLDNFTFQCQRQAVGDPAEALRIIIKYCGIRDPSWAELHHFVNFLNSQLRDCEESIFCNTELVGDLLQGFRTFVVRFLIQMSRDFATRSLSDGNLTADETLRARDEEDDLIPFQIRRRWELSPHPYIFFNQDHHSMTFLGFLLSANGDLLNPVNKVVLEPQLMNPTLRGQLKVQGVDFDKNYETWDRMTRITNLCRVMGIDFLYDPDPTYELTTDNVEKILAIHMRFRCGIPVIIMGETGCGKTRLIRFMCELQAGPDGPKNMLLMKVHGGTSYKDIEKKMEKAEELALINDKMNIDTILFFDEANTTDAIDLIKEIMVDRRVNGRPINPNVVRLHFIAACNPYRKHTKEMIQKLESAGLGYHVSAEETEDKLGSIPLRQLVYRVHPLPESMRPLVWDFGQLTDHTEELYTRQIVRRFLLMPTPRAHPGLTLSTQAAQPILTAAQAGPSTSRQSTAGAVETKAEFIPGNDSQASCIAKVLSASQKYMREQKDECSFVSLRDVERAMKVMTWFYVNTDFISEITTELDTDSSEESSDDDSEEDDEAISLEARMNQPLNKLTKALVLGIGVCYHARLYERDAYCKDIAKYFTDQCPLPGGADRMAKEIIRCQRAFLNNIELGQNIARNTALSENVFMMAICTELRIPLFVVGKPGSSKSLAKDVISTHMKGDASQSELFKKLKQIHMQSYQCSPLSTPEGIVSTFRQCSKLQKDKDLKKFVSVVVLDEIGLAEDSPLMPLKTLHPLLEDGTATEEDSSTGNALEHLRVGFIGLSNWALDPAKMNRGIMLSRGVPTLDELIDSANGICSSDKHFQQRIEPMIDRLAKGYQKLYKSQKKSKTLEEARKEEFFGLRDFYSLVKMVYGFAAQAEDGQVSDLELEQAIRRNFSGLDDVDPIKIFYRLFPTELKFCCKHPSPESLPVSLIKQSLERTKDEGESRYLLVLTENYAALRILQQQFLEGTDHDPVIIFGSSFPKDQHYTQICRNINRIKVCMETGRMVILLNLESLYESLYDALNQYYLYLAGQKYVDLGLGSHRVKCRVADNFKLIVVAEKDVVYQRFPIPLINRLEKHFLVMSTGLTPHQTLLVKELEDWVSRFSKAKAEYSEESSFKPGDSFVGYHSDTSAAVIMKVSKHQTSDEQILAESKLTLVQCASPDAIARLKASELKHQADELWQEYFQNQKHKSMSDYLKHALGRSDENDHEGFLVQISTHSRLLSQSNAKKIASEAGFPVSQSRCISLQEFHTEQQFTKTIQEFLLQLGGSEGLLLVQCDNGEANFNLIACCRYLVVDTRRRTLEDASGLVKPIHMVFIIQLPKMAGGCRHFVGFQGGKWRSVHIDELRESHDQLPRIDQLVDRSVSELLQPSNSAASQNVEPMDVDPEVGPEDEHGSRADDVSVDGLNPTVILRNCLQAAAARVYDESVDVNRATRRIEIMLDLLPEDASDETDFSLILAKRVHNLLQQRDEKFWRRDQRQWLQNEALCRGRLQETGTFRKALWQKLSSTVSPMLSEVIAYVDRNQNLSLVQGEHDWKFRLWLAILNEDLLTPLSYDAFISPVSRKIRERSRVVNSGLGHHFQGKFPFSWIVKDIVNVLLLQVGADPSKTVVLLRSVIDSSPLGGVLKPFLEDSEVRKMAMKDYLHDFLHMVYKPTVEDEIELVYDALIAAAKGIHELLNLSDTFELDIALIHFTYSVIQSRLSSFVDLVHACPRVVKKLVRQRQNLQVGEMILDLVALEYCLKELEPTREELEVSEHRLIWCNRVQSVRPTMQVMARLITQRSQQARDVSTLDTQVCSIGEKSVQIMRNCRLTWVRLGVVRLLIEHTCTPGMSTHPADSQNAFKLWKALGENPDFSSVESMTIIERFLMECSEKVSKRYFKFGVSQCTVCMKPLEEPIQMPCQHVCCSSCARGWFVNHRICPICRHEVGEDFNVVVSEECRQALEEHNSFRNRCKSYFMELVALYCFGEESLQLPNPDLVTKFIDYVIKDGNKTEDFTPFGGEGIDTTPVVRSFILQQLLAHKGRDEQVRDYLEEYLRRAGGLAEERDHMIEVCVLCVQCMEDTETTRLLKCKEAGEDNQILMATQMLQRSLQTLSIDIRTPPNAFNVNSLQTVAATRAAVDVLSQYLDENYATNIKKYENLLKLLDVAKNLSANRSSVRLFLLKQLVRQYGIEVIKERCKAVELQWILPARNQQQEMIPDSFIVHHENYHTVREALTKAMLTATTDELDLVLQDLLAAPFARDCYLLLALFREVTTSYAMGNVQEKIAVTVLKKISQFMRKTERLSNPLKPLADDIVANFPNGNVDLLRINPGVTGTERKLAEIMVHFRIVLECLPGNHLLQPFRNLAINPAMMRAAFLPTMPQDYGFEAMQVNLDLGKWRWYECPNGHRYGISECGRANQNYECPTCNAPIGGVNHKLVSGNRDASRQDQTSTGHILGPAQIHNVLVTPERNLTPLACGVLRFLTHAAMLLGADQDIQNLSLIIKPQVHNVVEFLVAHLAHDIKCLAQSTGTNVDEAMQIIHLALTGIINQQTQQQQVNVNVDPTLSNKDSRTAWENAFMLTYLNPVLSNVSQLLQDSMGRMVRDERLGNDPLMRQLYELDTPNYDVMSSLDPMCSALWRYRTRVSVEHLYVKFQQYVEGTDGSRKCEILAEFLKRERHLRALQYLPDILKFQRQLSEKFHRRLDRSEAEKFTLDDFLKRAGGMKKQFRALANSFRMAWRLVRSSLSQNGRLSLPADLCKMDVPNSTPISMFLPTNTGLGRCALGLTSFLVTLHNEFLGRCKTLLEDESTSADVPLANVTKAHLIAYNPEKDLLPMILAHCDYSLKVGEGTVVEYNWKALERQLVDRFIRGRTRLTSLVELFVFSKDVCDGEVFTTLKQKIHQVELSRPVQDQILNELTQLTDVCDVLKSLHIAIGFLASAGGQPTMPINEYLHSSLKMSLKDGLKSSKAQQVCQLKHIISLWRLLSLERARQLTRHKQDPFDDISESVKKPLTKDQTFNVSRGLQKLNVDQFVRELLEEILLYLKHVQDEQLRWPLADYLDAKLDEKQSDMIDGLDQHLPQDILLEHAVETWKIACQKSEDYHERIQS